MRAGEDQILRVGATEVDAIYEDFHARQDVVQAERVNLCAPGSATGVGDEGVENVLEDDSKLLRITAVLTDVEVRKEHGRGAVAGGGVQLLPAGAVVGGEDEQVVKHEEIAGRGARARSPGGGRSRVPSLPWSRRSVQSSVPVTPSLAEKYSSPSYSKNWRGRRCRCPRGCP